MSATKFMKWLAATATGVWMLGMTTSVHASLINDHDIKIDINLTGPEAVNYSNTFDQFLFDFAGIGGSGLFPLVARVVDEKTLFLGIANGSLFTVGNIAGSITFSGLDWGMNMTGMILGVSLAEEGKAESGAPVPAPYDWIDDSGIIIGPLGDSFTLPINATINPAVFFDSEALLSIKISLKVAHIPEPGTLALFGLGLAGLGFSRRRKAAA